MKGSVFVLIAGFTTAAIGFEQGALMRQNQRLTKSFLTAQTFPKTFEDLSFADKVAIWQEGYEPFYTEYDSNGVCIKNCAYTGMTIEDELDMWNRQTEHVKQDLKERGIERTFFETDKIVGNESIPMREPLKNEPHISSGFGKRIHPISGQCKLHEGLDYDVLTGTPVYAPANGTVSKIINDSSCGIGLKIQHSNGYETIYCHLSSVLVNLGDDVNLDDTVAYTGNTGGSTGPHLHYAIRHNGIPVDPGALGIRTKAALGC